MKSLERLLHISTYWWWLIAFLSETSVKGGGKMSVFTLVDAVSHHCSFTYSWSCHAAGKLRCPWILLLTCFTERPVGIDLNQGSDMFHFWQKWKQKYSVYYTSYKWPNNIFSVLYYFCKIEFNPKFHILQIKTEKCFLAKVGKVLRGPSKGSNVNVF